MKRDMDLIIKILEFMEIREDISVIHELPIAGYNDGIVAYHVRRMYEAGLLDAETITSSTTESRLVKVLPFGLTWQGHEFLDSIRSKTVLKTVRDRLGNSLSDVPFSILKELLLAAGRSQLGL